jgi:hypothetical protein
VEAMSNDEMKKVQTLSKRLEQNIPQLQDYACNVYASKLALIDLKLYEHKDEPEFCEVLQNIRNQFVILGRAQYYQRLIR